MSSRVQGVVQEVTEFNSAAGKLYGIKVNGVSYGTYKTKPLCSRGDTVSFDFKVNGKFNNVDIKTLEVQAGVPQEAAGGLEKPSGSYQDKQVVISRQSAANTAAAFLQVIVAADAIPGTKKTSTPDEKYQILEALFNEKAEEFYLSNMAGVAPGGEINVPDSSTATSKAAGDGEWK